MTSVYVAMPTRDGDPNHVCFYAALQAANVEECARNEVVVYPNPYSVVENRNLVVEKFLETDCTHLMMIDDDVHVQPDAIKLLLSLGADVATGCYPVRKGNLVVLAVDHDGQGWSTEWPEETRSCKLCGAGCLLVHRRVLETLEAPTFRWPLFPMRSKVAKDKRGEDMRFCEDAIAAGFKIVCHHRVRCGHYAKVDLASIFDEFWNAPRTLEGQKHPPAWGSHIPALKSISNAFDIRTVIEFGAGEFSTKTFLDRDIFPNLERLISYEHDNGWIKRLRKEIDDDRWTFMYCHVESMLEAAGFAEPADLVFIDCGRPNKAGFDYGIRGDLLAYFEDSDSIVAMHDTETRPLTDYAKACGYKSKQNYVSPYGPSTGIFSNHHDLGALREPRKAQVANAE